MPLNVVFMGTPAFSAPVLRALGKAGHSIAAVYTQPARKAGRRGLALTPSPVAREAERLGLDVRTPQSFRDAGDLEALRALAPDVAVVVAYGLLLPEPVLSTPRHGCLNAHASLLPRWRGAAPIQRAIEAGDATTGVMVMAMEKGLDTGPVALAAETAIAAGETAGELHDRLSLMAADLMVEALERLETGALTFEDQAVLAARTGREPTYARKIDKSETGIDFSRSAEHVAARINAFSPFPGAWTTAPSASGPERVKVLRAVVEPGSGAPGRLLDDRLLVACGTGAARLVELQRAGGRPMSGPEFLRGAALAAGTRLGAP